MSNNESAIILSEHQLERRDQLETVVTNGVNAITETGIALQELRDSELYKSTHKSFPAYCQDKWGFGKSQAYRMIEAAGVMNRIVDNSSPIGDASVPVPNAWQVRELAKVPAEEQAEVWEEVVKIEAKPTAKAIKAVVERRKASGVVKGEATAKAALAADEPAEVKPPKEKVYRHDAPMPEYYYDDNKKDVPVELYPVWRRKNDYMMIAGNQISYDACDRLLTLGKDLGHQPTIEFAKTLKERFRKLCVEANEMIRALQPSVAFEDGTWTSKPAVL